MTLPQDLQKIVEEYSLNRLSDKEFPQLGQLARAYMKEGAEFLYSHLLSLGVEFDDTSVQAWFQRRPFVRAQSFREVDLVIDAAEFQHKTLTAIYQAKLAEKDARIKELEEYKAANEELKFVRTLK